MQVHLERHEPTGGCIGSADVPSGARILVAVLDEDWAKVFDGRAVDPDDPVARHAAWLVGNEHDPTQMEGPFFRATADHIKPAGRAEGRL
jgi:urease accessory protein UreE